MIRVVVTTDDAGMSVNVGGSVLTTTKTFDISAPELEAFLSEKLGEYTQRQITGWEPK